MKKKIPIILLIVLALFVHFIFLTFFIRSMVVGLGSVRYEPQEGVWYCEELQIQLSYEDDAATYITENGDRIFGICGTDRGSKLIGILCQSTHGGHYVGEELFSAEIASLDDDTLVLYAEDSGQAYVFQRID